LTKLNAKARNIYMEVFLAYITCMVLVGIPALSYRNSSCSIFVFSKDKSSELKCHLEQDKQ
jgi:hypothetical protein